ncbi:MAG TPA: hypothetical protein VFI37_17240 [Gaiellaceae bacterium]|jgi:hypothetical protein|nr:hypothetical protein [Gaiellaceae bacterium]
MGPRYEENRGRADRLREHAIDVLPLAVVLVGIVLFLAFWS